jgi:hypothetical protein
MFGRVKIVFREFLLITRFKTLGGRLRRFKDYSLRPPCLSFSVFWIIHLALEFLPYYNSLDNNLELCNASQVVMEISHLGHLQKALLHCRKYRCIGSHVTCRKCRYICKHITCRSLAHVSEYTIVAVVWVHLLGWAPHFRGFGVSHFFSLHTPVLYAKPLC